MGALIDGSRFVMGKPHNQLFLLLVKNASASPTGTGRLLDLIAGFSDNASGALNRNKNTRSVGRRTRADPHEDVDHVNQPVGRPRRVTTVFSRAWRGDGGANQVICLALESVGTAGAMAGATANDGAYFAHHTAPDVHLLGSGTPLPV
jgi:hypothetical protein